MLKQLIRPVNMFRNMRNPQTYLGAKFGLLKRDPLLLKLRNGVNAEVPMRLLKTFKESVFAEDYIHGFPGGIRRRLDKPAVVDVGANAGYFSLWWLSRHPGSKIICVEPIPENFALLKRNAALNPEKNILLFNGAVGGLNGQIVLRYNLTNGFTTAASVLKGVDGQIEISAKCLSLAQLMSDFALKQIDFLKLDCEGSEYSIIYQSDDTVLKTIRCIAIETHLSSEPRQNTDALADFLRSKQFHVNVWHSNAINDIIYAWRQ
jgi:FkbM family methyltransferase